MKTAAAQGNVHVGSDGDSRARSQISMIITTMQKKDTRGKKRRERDNEMVIPIMLAQGSCGGSIFFFFFQDFFKVVIYLNVFKKLNLSHASSQGTWDPQRGARRLGSAQNRLGESPAAFP